MKNILKSKNVDTNDKKIHIKDDRITKETATAEELLDNLRPFFKSGFTVLTLILLIAVSAAMVKKAKNQDLTSLSGGLISEKKLPIYCVESDEPKIALSFDAAWGNDDTRNILDILKKQDVHVTFFMTGGWVEKYPDDVKAISDGGHELGNHSENHKQMSQLSAAQCEEEIMKVHEKVKNITGKDMVVFRPPYGDYNDNLIDTVKKCGYNAIQWDVDSLDWKDYGVDSILSTVLNHKHLGNGSIILCHNGAKYTAQALEQLIKGLKDKGFVFVTMSELIYDGDFTMDTEGRQHPEKNEGNDTTETPTPSAAS